jgi:hypothetical protein
VRFNEEITSVSIEDPKLLTETERKYLQAKEELLRGFARFPDRASQIAEKYGVDVNSIEVPEKQANTIPLLDLYNSYFISKATLPANASNSNDDSEEAEDIEANSNDSSSAEDDSSEAGDDSSEAGDDSSDDVDVDFIVD